MDTRLISRFDISVVALALMVMSGQTSAAADYRYIDLGPGTAYDINNSGQIVGSDGANAVVWNGDSKTVLGPGVAYGINNIGQIVGLSGIKATLWEGTSSITLLPPPGPGYAEGGRVAFAINDAGKIVGNASDNSSPVNPVAWEDARAPGTIIGFRGEAYDINNKGQIIGNSFPGSFIFDETGKHFLDFEVHGINNDGLIVGRAFGQAAFQHPSNNLMLLDTLEGFLHARADGVNDNGSIVGFSYNDGLNPSPTSHATYWDADSPSTAAIDLNSFLPASVREEGWMLINAQAINNSGSIIGQAYNTGLDLQHAFVLSIVPEPETYALLLTGLGMICFLRYRRGSGYR